MYKRILDLTNLLKKKSFFLFGPRGTGKTTLLRHTLSDATVIDLLEIFFGKTMERGYHLISQAILRASVPARFAVVAFGDHPQEAGVESRILLNFSIWSTKPAALPRRVNFSGRRFR